MNRWKIRRFGHNNKFWWGVYLADWSDWKFTDSWAEAVAYIDGQREVTC